MRGSVTKVNLALAVFGLGVAMMPMLAHHSVEAQYDTGKVVTIQGVVTKIVWVNPHALVWLDTSNGANPISSSWEMELPPPNALKIRNVKMDFAEGDQVTVTFWRAKDESRLGHALTMTGPDGRVMDFPRIMKMGAPTK
jgi:hypothetical protein